MTSPQRRVATMPDEPTDGIRPGGPRLGRAVARIEVRRTGAAWITISLGVVGAVLLLAKQPPFGQSSTWSSTWADAAGWLSVTGLVLGPLVAAAAAWVGGRGARHKLGELLATAARPAARRGLLTWWAMLAGVLGGFVVYAAVIAMALMPTVSYFGGRWMWAWWLVALGWVACAGIGFAAGQRLPGRLVPPLVGVAIYILCGIPTYLSGAWIQLMPVGQLRSSGGFQLIGWVIPVASVWLLGLTATAIGLALNWKPIRVLIPAAVAIVAAIPLSVSGGGDEERYAGDSWMESDPAATELVCTDDEPTVCLFAEHAGLLPDVTPIARQLLAAPLGIDRAVESNDRHPSTPGTLPLPDLDGHFLAFSGGLADSDEYRHSVVSDLTVPRCSSTSGDDAIYSSTYAQTAITIAMALVSGDPPNEEDPVAVVYEELTSDSARGASWMTDYLQAADECNADALSDLGRHSK